MTSTIEKVNVESNFIVPNSTNRSLDFSSPIWRNTLIASLVTVGAYKYAPEPGDDTYLTRWIALYQTPRETWLEINAVHTAKQQEASTYNILLSDARKEPAHRYRYPQ